MIYISECKIRNQKILELAESGVSRREISEKFEISRSNLNKVLSYERFIKDRIDLGLNCRARNCLRNSFNLSEPTLDDLEKLTYQELISTPNLGTGTVNNIIAVLELHGRALRSNSNG